MNTSVFLGLEENYYSWERLKKQSISLQILYRSVTLRIDLRSTVQATEVAKGQGLYPRFGDFH